VFDRWLRHFLDEISSYRRLFIALAACLGHTVFAQDLAPRAYVITPLHSNAVVATYSFFDGNLDLQGGAPITDSTARAHVPVLALFHSFNMFTRSASLTAGLPYGKADFHGKVQQNETDVHRSGLVDSVYRLSVNLFGGPAMAPREFIKWQQKNLLGISLKVVAPTGQYDPTKLINLGNNRWAFKPEVGYSRRNGHWLVDAYFGTWFYTKNPKYFSQNQYTPDVHSRTQAPVGALEGHLSYDVKPRFWVSFDANYWYGGKISLDGVENPSTELRSSRLGGTASLPINRHQAVKFSYSNGAYIRYGGDFQNVSVAWQYSWLGRPK